MYLINKDQEGKALPLELVDAFVAFVPAYVRWMKSCLPENYLTHGRIRLLYALHRHGPQIMSDLSEELEMTPKNITTLVDALEREGLVCRRPHPTDRRATFIELTPRGAEGCATIYEEYAGAVSMLFSELSEGDQRELLRLVTALRSALRHKGITGEHSEGGRGAGPKANSVG
jgi:DNA-binding MarR family transcriptional regulator